MKLSRDTLQRLVEYEYFYAHRPNEKEEFADVLNKYKANIQLIQAYLGMSDNELNVYVTD